MLHVSDYCNMEIGDTLSKLSESKFKDYKLAEQMLYIAYIISSLKATCPCLWNFY